LTDEESYNEDPEQIRRMLMEGIVEGGGEPKTEEIADRRDAIEKAMKVARAGDTILVTGMGHEQFRIINGEKHPWNDGEVVRELAIASKKPVEPKVEPVGKRAEKEETPDSSDVS
jgi:UDP-N-acetylmuramoyl-L-alanyl-D-glutamate--2,6-diaminopimelate ligase